MTASFTAFLIAAVSIIVGLTITPLALLVGLPLAFIWWLWSRDV